MFNFGSKIVLPLVALGLLSIAAGCGVARHEGDQPAGEARIRALVKGPPDGTGNCAEFVVTNIVNHRSVSLVVPLGPAGTETVVTIPDAPAGDVTLSARVTATLDGGACVGPTTWTAGPVALRLAPGEEARVALAFVSRAGLIVCPAYENIYAGTGDAGVAPSCAIPNGTGGAGGGGNGGTGGANTGGANTGGIVGTGGVFAGTGGAGTGGRVGTGGAGTGGRVGTGGAPPPVPEPVNLTVTLQGTGTRSVLVNRTFTCTSNCTNQFPAGSTVLLIASGNFTAWSGACAGANTNPTCTVVMDANKNAIASFAVPPPPGPVLVAELGTANFGPVALSIPQAGAHSMKIDIPRGMAQGWVTLYRRTGSTRAFVVETSCTSSEQFSTCQNTTSVNLTTTDQYEWEFHMVSLPSFSETQGGRVTLTRP